MNEIEIDNHNMMYLSQDYFLTQKQISELSNFSENYNTLTRSHPHLRRVIFSLNLKTPKQYFYLLHWDNNQDLTLLDSKVASGESDENDFAHALLCEMGSVQCLKCKNERILAKYAVGILNDSVLRMKNHKISYTCPDCGDDRYAGHTEVLS